MLKFIKKLFGKTDAVVEAQVVEVAGATDGVTTNWPFPKPVHAVESSEDKKPTIKKATTRPAKKAPAKKAPAKITTDKKPAKKAPKKSK